MSAARKICPLLGESFAIEELRDFIVGVSILSDPVLITGESGTGKALAASKIHAVGRSACLALTDRARKVAEQSGDLLIIEMFFFCHLLIQQLRQHQ